MILNLTKKIVCILTCTWVLFVPMSSLADSNNIDFKSITITDKYGNYTGEIKKFGNTYTETDKYGNVRNTYRKTGNTIIKYDKYNNVVGSYRK